MSQERSVNAIERVGGRLCLDFINTVHRRPAGPGDEYLLSLDDFFTWGVCVGLLPRDTARALGRHAAPRANRLLAELVELREVLYRVFRAPIEGREPAAGDLAAFEESARVARARQRLRFADGRAQWYSSRPQRPDAALADPIVIDADELLTGRQLDRVKQCDPEQGCGWLFLDTTRNRSRRWCSMETCGSAAKARAWYHRHRGSA